MERYEQYIGTVLNNRYKIEQLIGIGGMAYVFKARVLPEGETVAVKILNDESRGDEKAVQRFVNESRTVSMLSHPNIVKITDVAFDCNIQYIVMEYVDGITLKEYIDYKKKLEWREAVYYISQVLRALEHAHSMGIIHRDVKPQNIMITRDGAIKVMDFGIAKVVNSETVTMTDKAIGTVNYISPEQASGKTVGFSSDIYSVGVMLYEMTTGVLPFVADSPMAVAMMQIQNEPQDPTELCPDIPLGLEQIILKAMRKEPDDRFSSCDAMDKALALVTDDPTTVFSDRSLSAGEKRRRTKGARGTAKQKASLLPIIAGVTAAFFITAAGAGIAIGRKAFSEWNHVGEDVKVPELIGEVYSDTLEQTLREQNIDPIVEYIRNDPEKQVGEILDQNPAGGGSRRLAEGEKNYKLTLKVNAEPGKIILDDYVNTDARVAGMELKKLNLPYTVVTRNDDTIIEGYVIRTEPVAGTTMEEGSSVILYVSSGAALSITNVPDVVGLSLEEAKKALQIKEISVGTIRYEDSEKQAGTVLSITPDIGEKVPKKITSAELTVSNGSRYVEPIQPPSDTTQKPDESDKKEDPAHGGKTDGKAEGKSEGKSDEKSDGNSDNKTNDSDSRTEPSKEPDKKDDATSEPDPIPPDSRGEVPSPDSQIPAPSEV